MEDEQFIKLSESITEAKVLIASNASTLEAIHERQNNVLERMLKLESNAAKVNALIDEQKLLPRVISLEGSRYRWAGAMGVLTVLLTVSGFFFSGPIKDIVNVPVTAAANTEAHNRLNEKVDENNKSINGRVDVLQDRFNKLDGRVNELRDKVINMYPKVENQ